MSIDPECTETRNEADINAVSSILNGKACFSSRPKTSVFIIFCASASMLGLLPAVTCTRRRNGVGNRTGSAPFSGQSLNFHLQCPGEEIMKWHDQPCRPLGGSKEVRVGKVKIRTMNSFGFETLISRLLLVKVLPRPLDVFLLRLLYVS